MTPARSRGPRLHLVAVIDRFIRFAASARNVFDRFKRGRVYESTPVCSSLYCPSLLSSTCTGRFNLQPKRLAPSSPGRGSLNILQSAPCASLHQMFATHLCFQASLGKIVNRDLCAASKIEQIAPPSQARLTHRAEGRRLTEMTSQVRNRRGQVRHLIGLTCTKQAQKSTKAIVMPFANLNWPRGVTVSTLDSESSDRGSNPREAFIRNAGLCAMLPRHPDCTTQHDIALRASYATARGDAVDGVGGAPLAAAHQYQQGGLSASTVGRVADGASYEVVQYMVAARTF